MGASVAVADGSFYHFCRCCEWKLFGWELLSLLRMGAFVAVAKVKWELLLFFKWELLPEWELLSRPNGELVASTGAAFCRDRAWSSQWGFS